MMVLNILPRCNSVLHYVVDKANYIKEIYRMSEIKGEEFEIPFIINLD
jgi:hypothetical protein